MERRAVAEKLASFPGNKTLKEIGENVIRLYKVRVR